MEEAVSKNIDPMLGILAENPPITDLENDETKKQLDLKVTSLDNTSIEYNHHSNASDSVVNSAQEPGPRSESQQLSNNISSGK